MLMPRRSSALMLLAACLSLPSFVSAADTSPSTAPSASPATPPPYSVVRWDEDYSYLKNPANRSDFFDPIKYIPLGEDSYLSVGGSARYRYEYFNNATFGSGTQDEDGYHLSRFLLHADLHLSPYFRFFIQGKSAMEDGREGGFRAGDSDESDIQQAFGDLILPVGDKSNLTLRLGRQEMVYGNQRLIAVSDWTNAQRTYEGARVTLNVPGDKLDLFWVRPVVVDAQEPNDGDGNNSFAGIYNTLDLPNFIKDGKTKLETYFLALNREAAVDSDVYTLGFRFVTKPKPWDFEVEADYQFGDYDSREIGAYSLATEVGYTFAGAPLAPRPFVGFDIASGSADPANRFNQLFPNGHAFFGYIDVVGRMNIIDLHPGVTLTLAKNVTLRAEDHFFWRQNTSDGLYNSGGNLLRAAGGSDAAYIGNEFDLLLNWQINRHLSTCIGYSHFFTGSFVDQTGPSKDIDFIYASVNYMF